MATIKQHKYRTWVLAGIFMALLSISTVQSHACDLLIPSTEGFIDGHENASGIGPGDTICLLPGNRSFLWIRYLHGTAESPIVIINTIGLVAISQFYYGIQIDSCSHVKLSGKGVSAFAYGIQIFDIYDGAGLSIGGLSSEIEVEGIEIFNTTFPGFLCKTDPDCSFTSTRDKYVMRNISIHDNYIHDTGTEGFYIGSSFYTGYTKECNGKDTLLFPHLIRGLKVFNNRLSRTGWDGIQTSSTDSSCSIYNNEILYDSERAELNQMSGIILGEGSICDCYNNRIMYGKGTGIQIHGLGGSRIYNNLIVNPGRTYYQEYPYMNGFYVGNQSTLPGASFLFAYNTIISPKDYGIDFRSITSSGNRFINNIVMDYGRGLSLGSNISFQNNFSSPAPGPTWFVDPGNGNYDLLPDAPGVNAAVPVSQFDLMFDILNRTRPFALVNDLGAYECHDSSLIAIPELTYNPAVRLTLEISEDREILYIRYTLSAQTHLRLGLYDQTGRLTETLKDSRLLQGDYQQQVHLARYSNGLYIVRLTTGKEAISKKFLLIR